MAPQVGQEESKKAEAEACARWVILAVTFSTALVDELLHYYYVWILLSLSTRFGCEYYAPF